MSHMSLANVTSGRIDRPLKVSLYGVDGVGKTKFAASAPNPIFIATEDGTHHVDVARFPVPNTWQDIVGPQGALAELATQPHDFKTLVIDSMDWAEALCDRFLVEQHNATYPAKPIQAVSDIPYGQWKQKKLVTFKALLDLLSYFVRERGMHIIVISHAEIIRFEDPERDTYERYSLKLFKSLAALVREWADYNLFANYDTVTSTIGDGFDARKVGVSHGKRLLFSQRTAAYDAKARYPIPTRLEIPAVKGWDFFWQHHLHAMQNS